MQMRRNRIRMFENFYRAEVEYFGILFYLFIYFLSVSSFYNWEEKENFCPSNINILHFCSEHW